MILIARIVKLTRWVVGVGGVIMALRLIDWALRLLFLFEIVNELAKCCFVFRWTLGVSVMEFDI